MTKSESVKPTHAKRCIAVDWRSNIYLLSVAGMGFFMFGEGTSDNNAWVADVAVHYAINMHVICIVLTSSLGGLFSFLETFSLCEHMMNFTRKPAPQITPNTVTVMTIIATISASSSSADFAVSCLAITKVKH